MVKQKLCGMQVYVLVIPKLLLHPVGLTENQHKVKMQGKGSRLLKGNSQKKGYRVNLKMATEEYYTLKAKALDAGMTTNECIRKSIMNSIIRITLVYNGFYCYSNYVISISVANSFIVNLSASTETPVGVYTVVG